MRSFLKILFFFFLVSEMVFSFSNPSVWQYPVSENYIPFNFQEEELSSLQNNFFQDFAYFEYVEKDEQNEENEENIKQSKNQISENESDFSKFDFLCDSPFLTQHKNYISNFLLIQKESFLVLFHSWKFHI
ncbi:MAG: hypothetical protein KBF35_07130 [Saprospiraceae bacterium]|nr:hypothetical protein [Saprospiraceae bacterium]